MRGAIAAIFAVVAAGVVVACGATAVQQEAPTPSPEMAFFFCPGATPPYVLAAGPSNGCRALSAGTDYADGRVIVGIEPGTSGADLGSALAAYHASAVGSPSASGQLVLQVPDGSVPSAVVGLERYPFITFAQPDLLQHVDQTT